MHGDIRDAELAARLLREHEVTTIVHFAAESHVDRSIHGPDAFVDTNVVGTHALLKAARRVGWTSGTARRRSGSITSRRTRSTARSAPTSPPFREDTAYAPNSPYAASKAGSDHLVRAYHHTYGLPVTTSNCSNNYGPFQFPEKLIPLMLVNALEGKPLPIYGDGLNVRDWLYVEDHCRAVERVLLAGRAGRDLQRGRAQRVAQHRDRAPALPAGRRGRGRRSGLVGAAFPSCPASSGRETASLMTFVKDRPGHDRRYAIDAGRIERELGFVPAESFETGIRKTIAWYLGQRALVAERDGRQLSRLGSQRQYSAAR